ncbi:putative methyltransferase (TIGR04325 family) [Bradyrhizobium sp. USDA 4354]
MSFTQRLRRRLFPPRDAIEGYENEELVDTIYRKTVAYHGQANWPLVDGLKAVLDFGGGAGVHYKTARRQSPDIRWAVVETPAMVRRAKVLATDKLGFFDQIEQAADWLGSVDLVHSNGAIQYVPNPTETIQTLCAVRATRMAWYRVPIGDGPRREVQTSYLSDNGPGVLPASEEKLVRYERNWISEGAFVEAHEGYRLVMRSPDPGEHQTQQFLFERR